MGLVHTQDIVQASEAIEAGRWKPQEVQAQELPGRYGFVRSPAQGRPITRAADA